MRAAQTRETMAERLNRGIVVARAADLSDEVGLESLTLTLVSRAVGIAAPGVYRHVADGDDLRAAIGLLAADEVSRMLAEATAGRAGRDALGALADALREWATAHPGRYAALQIAPDLDDAPGQAGAGRVLAVIGAALQAYGLVGDDFTDAVRMVRSTLHGFIDLERHSGFKQPRDVDVSFARIVDGLDRVLGGWAVRH